MRRRSRTSYLYCTFYAACSGVAAALALHMADYLWVAIACSIGAALLGLASASLLLDAWRSR